MALTCRLMLPEPSCTADLVHDVLHPSSGTWSHSAEDMLCSSSGMSREDILRCLRTPADRRSFMHDRVRPWLRAQGLGLWQERMASYRDIGMAFYAEVVDRPCMPSIHRAPCSSRAAAAWCRLRHGGSTLPCHRGARHRSRQGGAPCPLCHGDVPSVAHALFCCPGLSAARARWWFVVGSSAPAQLPPSSVEAAHVLLRWFFHCTASASCAAAHARLALSVEQAYGALVGLGG